MHLCNSADASPHSISTTNEYDGGVNRSIQTIPSGCVHLVFHRGCDMLFPNGEKQPKNFIRGHLSTPNALLSAGGIDMIAVVFHPLGITPFLSHPISELYNQYIDVEDFKDADLIALERFITNEEDACTCIREIGRCLTAKLKEATDYNCNRILHTIQSIKNETQYAVSALADDAYLGYRHFNRIFT